MDLLSRVAELLQQKPFRPHQFFSGGHAQTLAAYAWPRRSKLRPQTSEERLFEVSSDTKVLAHCHWQPDRTNRPTIVIWHGIEGSSSSVYMLAIARKGFEKGFNVIRMNLRNCGDTEHLTPTLYHGGLSEDLREVVGQLIEGDRLKRLALVGYSLGGNMVLKLAGEYGDRFPAEVRGVVAVSPSVDLGESAKTIEMRSNWIYHRDFMRRLRNRIRRKQRLYPELYDITPLRKVRTLREFDNYYTSIAHGFSDADDYYYRASSIRVIDQITIPTFIIHAEDDPFIPYAPLRHPTFADNPNILLHSTERGGHIAFISDDADGEDRFWAENRVLDFCSLATE